MTALGIIARMSPFYTRTGDEGTTGLLGEGRVPKFDPRIEALGALDEATAALGLARATVKASQIGPLLLEAQRDLYLLMAEVGATPENAAKFRKIDESYIQRLEKRLRKGCNSKTRKRLYYCICTQ